MSKKIHDEYCELLNEILSNARVMARASNILLKNHLNNKNLCIGPMVQFLLYSCSEECGKFLIVKDLYPTNLNEKLLRDNGFADHIKKWGKLLRYYSEQTGDLKNQRLFGVTSEEAAKLIRSKIREPSLYVEYKQGKIIKPGFVNEKAFNKLVKVAVEFIKLCDYELSNFRQTPILHSVTTK